MRLIQTNRIGHNCRLSPVFRAKVASRAKKCKKLNLCEISLYHLFFRSDASGTGPGRVEKNGSSAESLSITLRSISTGEADQRSTRAHTHTHSVCLVPLSPPRISSPVTKLAAEKHFLEGVRACPLARKAGVLLCPKLRIYSPGHQAQRNRLLFCPGSF